METEKFNPKNPFDWFNVFKIVVEWIITIIKSLKTSLFGIKKK